MPSVVHLDTSRSWRGGQLQVFLLHRELLRLGVGSRLLVRANGALHLRCLEAGIPVEPIPLMRAWFPPTIIAVWQRSRKATIVHAHDSHAATLAAMVRTLTPGLTVVCHRRVAFPPRAALTDRWKYRRIDGWIAVSAEIAAKLRRAGGTNIRIVPSAIDIRSSHELERQHSLDHLRSEFCIGASSHVVGLVGALDRQKGHQTLVEAAPKILEVVPEMVFLCVGDGRLRRRLRRQIRRAGLDGSFRFTGFRRDVPDLIDLCTVVIAPSIGGEGSSAVIKEAMAIGVPVIASGLPSNLEVLDSAGVAIRPNDPGTLADAVVMLIGDSDRRAELTARGRARSALWAPQTMATRVLAAYQGFDRVAHPLTEAV